MKNKIIAVDFDGTLCENKYPEIGEPRHDVIKKLLQEQRKGAHTILWTCRRGEELAAAVYWCIERGLVFDAINDNLKYIREEYGGDSRKIYADEYWDDKAVLPCERDATAFAIDILNLLEARASYCNRRAERLGAFVIDGVEAKIKAGEVETLRELIENIIKDYGLDASNRYKK